MFSKLGADLPITTQILIGMSDFFIHQVVLASGYCIGNWLCHCEGTVYRKRAKKWDKLKMKLPVIGTVVERSLLARFSRSFSDMLASVFPLLKL